MRDASQAVRVAATGLLCALAPVLPASLAPAAEITDPPEVFAGVLRDDAGNAVAGAKIKASNVGGMHCGMIEVRESETTTRDDGSFALRTGFYPVHLSVESEIGTVHHPRNPYRRYRKVPLEVLRHAAHEIVLMRWAEVAGRVVDRRTGGPVREFSVHFATVSSHAPRKYRSEDGAFMEARFIPGEYTITVTAAGYAPSIIPSRTVPPGTRTDIRVVRMSGGPTLDGRIVARDTGRPIAGAKVRFRDPEGLAIVSYPPFALEATTDDEGRFAVRNMPLIELEALAFLPTPRRRMLTVGTVDMSQARNGALDITFRVDVGAVNGRAPRDVQRRAKRLMQAFERGDFRQSDPPLGTGGPVFGTRDGQTLNRDFLAHQTKLLIALGREAVPELIEWLEHRETYVRYIAARSLQDITGLRPTFYYHATPGQPFDGDDRWSEKAVGAWRGWYDAR
ncbi:MAG: MSCRAMM family protein [Planctomycetota bacterium]|jgi:hypothetical protein